MNTQEPALNRAEIKIPANVYFLVFYPPEKTFQNNFEIEIL